MINNAIISVSNLFPATCFKKEVENMYIDNNLERGYQVITVSYHYTTMRELSVWIKNHPQNQLGKITVIANCGKPNKIKRIKFPCKLHSLKIRDDGLITLVLYGKKMENEGVA